MRTLIAKLSKLLNEGGNRHEIDDCEYDLVASIEEAVAEDSFFSLPTNEILKIIQKSGTENVELLCSIITKMNKRKGSA